MMQVHICPADFGIKCLQQCRSIRQLGFGIFPEFDRLVRRRKNCGEIRHSENICVYFTITPTPGFTSGESGVEMR